MPMALAFDGIALIAHGARDARWMVPLHRLKSELAQRLAPTPVSLAFLEFATPRFSDAVAELYSAGARRVLVAPIFLSGGGHVAKDVPELVRPERERYPDVEFVVTGAIGEEPDVASAMVDAVARLAGR
jgi:sirohydrochlorin cobaltochelatase